jgi:pyridoxal phosphate enzyme (YggS family)
VSGDLDAEVRERLAAIRSRIETACARAGRDPGEVHLIGVSKRQPLERVVAAVRAGVLHLGENYVQELRAKRERVAEALALDTPPAPEVHWRMIGGLQRNKANAVVPLVDAVDSVDRESLAVALDRSAASLGRKLDVCLQVNLSDEPQKSGVDADGLPALLYACSELENLRVIGLMTVPAAAADPENSRAAFARLRELRDTLRRQPERDDLRELSMGMSADFEVAIEEGATLVRVGTALFGERPDSDPQRTA